MKRIVPLGLILLAVSTACGDREATQPTLRPVRTIEVFTSAGGRDRTFSGTTRAGIESVLSFRVPGTVVNVPVSVGQRVISGQLIAQLDPGDFLLKVQEAEATLSQARAGDRNTQANYDRVRDLYENGNASLSELDAARAAAESSKATVIAGETRLALAQSQLSYATLRAPVEGDIAAVTVEVNENVGAGQAVAVLSAGEVPEVEVAMPENLITQLRSGQPATVTLDALPSLSFQATITEVGIAATAAGATFPVVVRLDAPDPNVRPGMAASVTFYFGPTGQGSVALVPPAAVAEDRGGRYAFIIELESDSTGITRRRAVRVGELTASGLTVLEGLSDGDLLVTAGVSRIRDGDRVRLLDYPVGSE